MNIMAQGLIDYLKGGETLFSNDSIRPFMDEYIRNRAMAEQQKNLDAGQKFLEDKKKDSKIQVTESGLLYEVIQEGEGESPTIDSQVTVNYIGKTIDGKTFDESKGEPVTFPLGGVIRGWQEGLQLMKPGAKYKFYIPAELAYGQYGSGPIGPNETLIFDVELISFE
jgi:FKBP-type peptidyl-prolyl cis-trans isomerase